MIRIHSFNLLLGAALMAFTATVGAADNKHSGSDQLHHVMMDGMKDMHAMKMTGNVDKDFAAMMIHHHEQAVAMSKAYLEHGQNPELKKMADRMASEQQKEIQELKRFK